MGIARRPAAKVALASRARSGWPGRCARSATSPSAASTTAIKDALLGCHASVTINQGYVSEMANKLVKDPDLTIADLRIGAGQGPKGKIESEEAAIVEMLLQASQRGHHLYMGEVQTLVGAFVEGSEHADAFKDNTTSGLPSTTWVNSFLNRHKDQLTKSMGNRKSLCRVTWATHDNMRRWLDFLRERFVKIGIAADAMTVDVTGVQRLSCIVLKPERIFCADEMPVELGMEGGGGGAAPEELSGGGRARRRHGCDREEQFEGYLCRGLGCER